MQDTEVRFFRSHPEDSETQPDEIVWHKNRYPAADIDYILPGCVRIEWYYIGDDDCEIPLGYATRENILDEWKEVNE